MIQVAMISKWHVHAAGYAKHLQGLPDVNIKYVWDEDPARGLPWAQELGAIFEPTLHELLEKQDLDAIIVCSPTNMHPDIMVRAAQAGKHIFTEKALAFTVKDCDRVAEAVRKGGAVFTISFPHRCMPTHIALKKAVDDGTLGRLTLMRVRNAHNGALAEWLPGYWYDPETTGGGAMMDLGAHPMYLLRWYLGKPARIQSMFNTITKRGVDDNAVSVVEFGGGAIGVSETSLVSPMAPYLVEAYGTEGVAIIEDGALRIKSKKFEDEGAAFHAWELPPPLPSPLDQFIASVRDGSPVMFGLDEARQLTELTQYAYQAHREGRQAVFA
ncbi:MAG: Gfo/Idh/MocA family oxidoreductase [Oscillospiraceae bacterium]|jgi:predicted dehydrogenase|nr:Gfo/Idh/MocA family oxidoreductase [Oscillospiraceae bacterium]